MILNQVDHLVFGTPDLEQGINNLEALTGVRALAGGQHPGYGTRNALLALGPETYLEIIGPDPKQPKPDGPRVFGIDDLDRPRLVTWAAKEQDLEDWLERSQVRDFEFGEIVQGSRRKPDGTVLTWRHTDPYVTFEDGIIPCLIDWGDTTSPARTAAKGCTLVGLQAEHPEAERVEKRLKAIGLFLTVEAAPEPALIATIDTPRGRVELR